jgi:hypothetical protein
MRPAPGPDDRSDTSHDSSYDVLQNHVLIAGIAAFILAQTLKPVSVWCVLACLR